MIHRLTILLVGLSAGWLTGCVSPVEFSGPEPDQTLVVSGLITDNPAIRFVNLNWLQPVSPQENVITEPITFAQVFLIEGEQEVGEFELTPDGTYIYTQDLELEPTQTYELKVLFQDGTVYRSRPSIVPESYTPDSITFDYQERVLEIREPFNIPIRRMFIDVLIHNTLPPNSPNRFFRWEVDESWSLFELPQANPFIPQEICYFFRDRTRNPVSIQSSENVSPGPFSKFLLTRELDLEFKDRHFFNVYQYSVSREAFEYFERVERLGSELGNIFDEIPAAVTGNVYNTLDPSETVLGFVEFSRVDTFRQDIFNLLIPVTFFQDCANFSPQPFCFECESIRGASFERPDYWD